MGASYTSTQQSAKNLLKLGSWLNLVVEYNCDVGKRMVEGNSVFLDLMVTSLTHVCTRKGKSFTNEELQRIIFDEVGEREVKCQCSVHKALELQELPVEDRITLDSLCILAAENQSRMMSGNLSNMAVEIIKVVLCKAGIHLHIVPEQHSDYLSEATAHVRFVVGNGDNTMVVDGTPDFSGKTLSSFTSSHTAIYIFVGECQSCGVRDPKIHLALNTLGMLVKQNRQQMAAVLLSKTMLGKIFLGQGRKEEDKVKVSFKPVNSASGFQLTDSIEFRVLCNTSVNSQ